MRRKATMSFKARAELVAGKSKRGKERALAKRFGCAGCARMESVP